MSAHKPKMVTIHPDEYVLAVVPEFASGPGWSNAPLSVHIVTRDWKLRTVCIQPYEQTPEMRAMFAAGCAMCNALRHAVPTRVVRRRKSK